jgi:hypothetical protein
LKKGGYIKNISCNFHHCKKMNAYINQRMDWGARDLSNFVLRTTGKQNGGSK